MAFKPADVLVWLGRKGHLWRPIKTEAGWQTPHAQMRDEEHWGRPPVRQRAKLKLKTRVETISCELSLFDLVAEYQVLLYISESTYCGAVSMYNESINAIVNDGKDLRHVKKRHLHFNSPYTHQSLQPGTCKATQGNLWRRCINVLFWSHLSLLTYALYTVPFRKVRVSWLN